MVRWFPRPSINVKLTLLIATLVLVAVSVFAGIAYHEARKAATADASARLESIAQQLSALVARQFTAAQAQLARAAAAGDVVALAAAGVPADSAPAALRALAGDTSQVMAVEIRARDGRVLVATRPFRWASSPAPPPPDSAAISPLYAVGDTVLFRISAPILVGGAAAGWVVQHRLFTGGAQTGMRQVSAMLGTHANLLLGNAADPVWTDFGRVVEAPPDSSRLGRAVVYRRDGAERLGAALPAPGTPWVLAAEFAVDEFLAPSRSLLERFVALALVVVGIGAAIGWLASRRLTGPLVGLTDAAEAVAAGDLDHPPMLERDDEIGRLAGSLRSMVARLREGHRQVRSSEEQYRLLFERNPNPMWVFDRETLGFLAVNDAAVRHYGYSRAEFLTMTIREIRPPEELPRLDADLARQPGDGVQSDVWVHRTRAGARIDVAVASQDIGFGGRPARLVLAQDVTERNRLESRLRQSQKMEAVGRLAGGIAHDFNNVLSAILSYADLLGRDLAPGSQARADVAEISSAAQRAAELTRQLLAFSRQQVLDPQVLDLNAVVDGMSRMLGRIIGEDVELTMALAPDAGCVRVDGGQLEQVVLNLVVNARDAMPAGGRLTIATSAIDAADLPDPGIVPGGAAGRFVVLEVGDDGVGIPAEQQARIFEPFFTTKEVGKGTGLGLATVYGIVQQSGGAVRVQSAPGRGAIFTVLFPSVAAEPAPPVGDRPAIAAQGGARLLLVEDEEPVRRVAVEILARDGHTVISAANAAEALAHFERVETVDLVVTDIVMPGPTGRELAARLRTSQPNIRVLFMSGYAHDSLLDEMLRTPNTSFLQKPFSAQALSAKVREALAGDGGAGAR